MNVTVRTTGVGLVCALALLAPGASAQIVAPSSGAQPEGAVAPVIIHARKRAENALDVPLSVSAIPGSILDERRLFQIEDLNQLSPSLNASYFNPRGSYVSIRGIGHSPASDGLEPSTAIFVDGVYLGRPGMAVFDLTDIDSVEVLRGPQGTLFGKNSSAGAIVIATRAPSYATEASAEASFGGHAYLQARGAIGGALVPGRVAARLAAYHTQHDGWVSNPDTSDRFNGGDRTGARLQVLMNAGDRLTLRLAAEYNVESDSCCALLAGSFGPASASYLPRAAAAGGAAVLGGQAYLTLDNAPNHLGVEQTAFTATTTYRPGTVDLTLITAYRGWRYRAAFDGDGSSADVYANAAVPTFDWQFSQELRVANQSGGAVDWVAGAYFITQSLRSTLDLQFGGKAANFLVDSTSPPPFLLAFNGLKSLTRSDLRSDTVALFGQTSWRVSRRLTLTAGARATYETKSARIDRPANPAQAGYLRALSVDFLDPSGTVALDYAAAPGVRLYAAYARGTKAGGVNPIVADTVAELLVKPEQTDSYEIGLKTDLLEGRLRVDASVFLERISDYQATYNRLFKSSLTNVGDVTSQGVEVAAILFPIAGVRLTATGSYNDAHYDSYHNAPCAPEAGAAPSCDLTGRPLSDAPRWLVNLAADYERPLGRGVVLSLAADYNFKSRYFGALDDSAYSILGGVGVLNARLGLKFPGQGLELSVWAKNLTDTRRLESYPLGGSTVYGAYFGTAGDPRLIGASVSERF